MIQSGPTLFSKHHIAIGESCFPFLENSLDGLNIPVLSIPDNPYVDSRLKGHADLSIFCPDESTAFISPHLTGTDFAFSLSELGYSVIPVTDSFGNTYPYDCALNICLIGDWLVANRKTASKQALEYCVHQLGKKPIWVNQGYAKCSICVLNDHTIITADAGIADATRRNGIETLQLESDCSVLEGYSNGFIGGCGFKFGDSHFCFTGIFDNFSLRDSNLILETLSQNKLEAVFLTTQPLFDIGGLILL